MIEEQGGGLIEVDTPDPGSMEWFQLKVRKPKEAPNFIQILDETRRFKVQLCRVSILEFSNCFTSGCRQGAADSDIKDADEDYCHEGRYGLNTLHITHG